MLLVSVSDSVTLHYSSVMSVCMGCRCPTYSSLILKHYKTA